MKIKMHFFNDRYRTRSSKTTTTSDVNMLKSILRTLPFLGLFKDNWNLFYGPRSSPFFRYVQLDLKDIENITVLLGEGTVVPTEIQRIELFILKQKVTLFKKA